MSWIESKHRRSEEKAEELQGGEWQKIKAGILLLGERIKAFKGTLGIYGFNFEVTYPFLSDKIESTDYRTDTYNLADSATVTGKIFKAVCLSPAFCEKHSFNKYESNKVLRIGNDYDFNESRLQNLLTRKGKFYSLDTAYIYYNDPYCREIHLTFKKYIPRLRYSIQENPIYKLEAEKLDLPETVKCSASIIGYYDNSEVVEFYFIIPFDPKYNQVEKLTYF